MKAKYNLQQHFRRLSSISLSEHFTDATRAKTFSIQHQELLFDYSKNHIDQPLMDCLGQLADDLQIKTSIDALFDGELVNMTERRPALHTILRDAQSMLPMVRDATLLERMAHLVGAIHTAIAGMHR